MNRVSAKRHSGLWALDAALLLLGLMVLLLVLRLLRFDDPDPLHNAWLYVLGVPTGLIATSMITRVLANDFIEKSIQLGFLLSVGLHLFFLLFAVNVVLFSNAWPSNATKLAVTPASQRSANSQFFQPTSPNPSRPDYLKPVQTEQNVAQESLDIAPQANESAKLNLDVAKDEIKPTLAEKPFNRPRKEPAPSQPTITSNAEKLDRPEPTKNLDHAESSIEVPKLESTQPTPSQAISAANFEAERAVTSAPNANALSAMPATKLEIESRANQGSPQGIRKSSKLRDDKNTNRELEQALNRTASDLAERPNSVQRSPRGAESDKPKTSDVPVPQLGSPLAKANTENPSERSTELSTRSRDSKASSKQSINVANLPNGLKLEPSLGSPSLSKSGNPSSRAESTSSLTDSSFLADPRLAMNDRGEGMRPQSSCVKRCDGSSIEPT